jgi:3-dehydroquinate synthase
VHIAPSGADLLQDYLARQPRPTVFVTDQNVRFHLWETLAPRLRLEGMPVAEPIVLPPGEASKSLKALSVVLHGLLRCDLERGGRLVALGGGVVTDLAGLAAATYKRGISWVAAPTTLLGMVDAAIGGKVGVNLLRTKNAMGCFHQPEAVLVGTDFLRTLPEAERRNGLAEIVKYAMIADRRLFAELGRGSGSRWGRSPQRDVELVARCCRIKARTVVADPFEEGQRASLNFGHSVGHALESRLGLRHGEAVALGMVVACAVAENQGLAREPLREPLVALLGHLGLPTRAPTPVSLGSLRRFLRRDKKSRDGTLRFVLTPRIGRVSIGHAVSEADLAEAIQVIAARGNRGREAGKSRGRSR